MARRPVAGDHAVTYDDGEAYTVGATADPDQVARRLHELRVVLEAVAGGDVLAEWDDLPADDRALGRSFGAAIVEWLVTTDPDTPDRLARRLHDVRRAMSGGVIRPWDDLAEDERAVAVALMAALIDWLTREGTIA